MEEYLQGIYSQITNGQQLKYDFNKDSEEQMKAQIKLLTRFKSFISIVKEFTEKKGERMEISSHRNPDGIFVSQVIIEKEVKSVGLGSSKKVSKEVACEKYIQHCLNPQQKEGESSVESFFQQENIDFSKLDQYDILYNYRQSLTSFNRFKNRIGENEIVQCTFMNLKVEGIGVTKDLAKNYASYNMLRKLLEAGILNQNNQKVYLQQIEQMENMKAKNKKEIELIKIPDNDEGDSYIKKKVKIENSNKNLENLVVLDQNSKENNLDLNDLKSNDKVSNENQQQQQIILIDKENMQNENNKLDCTKKEKNNKKQSCRKKQLNKLIPNLSQEVILIDQKYRNNSIEMTNKTDEQQQKNKQANQNDKSDNKAIIIREEVSNQMDLENSIQFLAQNQKMQQKEGNLIIDLIEQEQDQEQAKSQQLQQIVEHLMKEPESQQKYRQEEIEECKINEKDKQNNSISVKNEYMNQQEMPKYFESYEIKKFIDNNQFKQEKPNEYNSLSQKLYDYLSFNSVQQESYSDFANMIDNIEINYNQFKKLGMVCLKIVGSLYFKILTKDSLVGDVILVCDLNNTTYTQAQIKKEIFSQINRIFKGFKVVSYFNYISIKNDNNQNELRLYIDYIKNGFFNIDLHHWIYMKNYHKEILENQALKSLFMAVRRLKKYYLVNVNICILDALVIWVTKQFQFIHPQQNFIDLLHYIVLIGNSQSLEKLFIYGDLMQMHKKMIKENFKELSNLSTFIQNILKENVFDFLVVQNQ